MNFRKHHSGLSVNYSGQVLGMRGRPIKPWLQNGYRFVRSTNPTKSWKVSRIVAECFIPNPENKPEVNHKDGNKQNDRVSNLEWATRSENQKHAFRTGLQRPNHGERAGGSKLTAGDIKTIRKDYRRGCSIVALSKIYNVSHSNISQIVNNKTWKHLL